MLKDQHVTGYFLSGERYSKGQELKKGVIDVHGTTNYFMSDVLQKTPNKAGLSVVKITVCKKQTYNHQKGKNVFALKAKSRAEVLEVVSASQWTPNPVKVPELVEV